MNKHNLKTFQVQGLSADQYQALLERVGHHGLTVTSSGNEHYVAGQDLAGTFCHTPAANTMTVELHQIPAIVTPGQIVGRLYDEILHLR